MQKQQFYIIGHNPNSIEITKNFLKLGANALEPDICYAPDSEDKFYVSHDHGFAHLEKGIGIPLPGFLANPFTHEHSLAKYLQELSTFITPAHPGGTSPYNLALIMFDLKDYNYNINDLVKLVWDNFSKDNQNVAILFTVSDPKNSAFLNQYDQSISFAGVGIDQNDNPDLVQEIFEKAGQRNFTYADGTAIPIHPEYRHIMQAKRTQAKARISGKTGFSLVYTWVLKKKEAMRNYLGLNIDGIIIDEHFVDEIKTVLEEPAYRERYTIAQAGHNPFTAPTPPTYLLTVHTRDTTFAGTDAHIRFTITGEYGVSCNAIVDGGGVGVFEKDGTDHFTIEGIDVGKIKDLTIELLNTGLTAKWMPEKIVIESTLLHESITIDFANDEWIKEGHNIVKTVL